MFEPKNIKKLFPFFDEPHAPVFLDNAATTQKPAQVIDALANYYKTINANVGRGLCKTALASTAAYESARNTVAKYINAEAEEIVFVRNTTEAINHAAIMISKTLSPTQNIVATQLEHHSNYLPWLEVCKNKKAQFKTMKLLADNGELNAKNSIDENTALVAVSMMSNVLGNTPPLEKIISEAHQKNALVLLDAAQWMAHKKLDVKKLNADFVAFSGHKMFAPQGVGVLFINKRLHQKLDPAFVGGGMIRELTQTDTEWLDAPQKFEAGTPDAAAAIALAEAINFLEQFSEEDLQAHDKKLFNTLLHALEKNPQIRVLGPRNSDNACGLISFVVDGIHPHDIAQIMADDGICIRAGHHCAKPLHSALKLTASTRISWQIYNDESDILKAVDSLNRCINIFHK